MCRRQNFVATHIITGTVLTCMILPRIYGISETVLVPITILGVRLDTNCPRVSVSVVVR